MLPRAVIRDIRDPSLTLPDYLVIDANVFLHLPTDRDVVQFMTRVSQAYRAGQTLPMVCLQTLEECYHVLLRNSYSRDHTLAPRRIQIARREHKPPADVTWHNLYKDRPHAIKRYMATIDEFYQRVTHTLPVHVIEPEDLAASSSALGSIEERMRHYTSESCILTADARLVAEAERLGVYHIATLDHDLYRVGPRFTVYTMP